MHRNEIDPTAKAAWPSGADDPQMARALRQEAAAQSGDHLIVGSTITGSERGGNLSAGNHPVESGELEARARREWDANPALKHEFAGKFDLFLTYRKMESKNLIRRA